jgi:thiamine transport system ATP-binding protein
MLRVEDLTFTHAGQSTRYRFDLSAAAGEVTAISGASGSGKSTLLDLLAGFLTPLSGRIDLDGTDLVPLPPESRPVSLLLQSDNLFDHLSAARNVALGLPSATAKAAVAQQVETALSEVGLAGIGQQTASTLSGGQKQRVALARTLVRNRPIVLLDEPFSALDDKARATTRELVKALTIAHDWHTILVSHHMDDITAIASRRYRLEQGELVIED